MSNFKKIIFGSLIFFTVAFLFFKIANLVNGQSANPPSDAGQVLKVRATDGALVIVTTTIATEAPISNLVFNPVSNIGIGINPPIYKLDVNGDVRATSFLGAWSGTLSAANISSDVFGRNAGSGHFAFPNTLGIATSSVAVGGFPRTLSVYGGGYFRDNVGIGESAPTALLTVGSNNSFQVNSSGNVFVSPGGASTPSYSFINDANTGIYRGTTADNLRFVTNGNDVLAIDGSGNVGIGTTNTTYAFFTILPSSAGVTAFAVRNYPTNNKTNFSINESGAVYMTAFQLGTSTSATSGYVLTTDANGNGTWQAAAGGLGGSGAANYVPKFTGPTTLATSSIYNAGGAVGIFTTSPSYPLTISSSTDSLFGLVRAGAANPTIFKVGQADSALVINADAFDVLKSVDGKVAIATTTSPNYPLTVAGNTSDQILGLSRAGAVTSTIFKVGQDGAFIINAQASDVLTLKGGNLGVNNTNPTTARLMVTGDVDITGQYKINGTPLSSGGGGSNFWATSSVPANAIYYNAGNVGVGTATATERFAVGGGASVVEMSPPTGLNLVSSNPGVGSLGPGTFYFKISARGDAGSSGTSTSLASSGDIGPCDLSSGAGSCTLQWNTIPGVTYYRIYRSNGSSLPPNTVYTNSKDETTSVATGTVSCDYGISSGSACGGALDPTRFLPTSSTLFAARLSDRETSYFRGFVGFGTTNPQANLHAVNARLDNPIINGNITFNGDINVASGSGIAIGTITPPTVPLLVYGGVDAFQFLSTSTSTPMNFKLGLDANTGVSSLAVAAGTGNYSALASTGAFLMVGNGGDVIISAKTGANADTYRSIPGSIRFATNNAFNTATPDVERLTILNTGEIGIGTSTPTAKLHIQGGNVYVDTNNFRGTPTIDLAIGDTDTGFNSAGDGNLSVYTNNAERLRVTNNGNIGIGGSYSGAGLNASQLYVESAVRSYAVSGYNASTTSGSAGVYGQSIASGGRGVYGTGSYGIYGTGGSAGVYGDNTSGGGGIGVQGDAAFVSPGVLGRWMGLGVGAGGEFWASSTSGFNLKLPTRGSTAQGLYLFATSSACPAVAVLIGTDDGVQLCIQKYP